MTRRLELSMRHLVYSLSIVVVTGEVEDVLGLFGAVELCGLRLFRAAA